MAKNKFEVACVELEAMATWLKENGDEARGTGKSVCIFITDDKEKTNSITFVGDLEALVRLHKAVGDAIEENIDDVIKHLFKKALED